MTGPVVVRMFGEDSGSTFDFVDFRNYLEQRARNVWPHVRHGRGRPRGGGLQRLAEAMGLSPSRLSHLIRDAESGGYIRDSYVQRIALAFGDGQEGDALENFIAHYQEWWAQAFEEGT